MDGLINKKQLLNLCCKVYIKTTQASNANESVSEFSKSWAIHNSNTFTDVVLRKDINSHLDVTGVQFFRLQI